MSDGIEVKVSGLDRLTAVFERMPPALQSKLRVFFARFTIDLRDQVKQNILERFKSAGPLYQGVKSEITESPGSISSRVYIDEVPYAAIQEYGGRTPAHEIVPVNGAALAFMVGPRGFSSGGGSRDLVFAKHVNHPGSRIPERSYARLALYQMRAPFEQGIRATVDEALSQAPDFAMAAE